MPAPARRARPTPRSTPARSPAASTRTARLQRPSSPEPLQRGPQPLQVGGPLRALGHRRRRLLGVLLDIVLGARQGVRDRDRVRAVVYLIAPVVLGGKDRLVFRQVLLQVGT